MPKLPKLPKLHLRIFTNKTTLMSFYDANAESGEWKTRAGVLYEIEIWLHWFSVQFSFIRWVDRE